MTKGFYIRNTRWPPWQDKFDIAPYGNYFLLLLRYYMYCSWM